MRRRGELLDGNASAAWAARLAKVQCVPAFPITPQTEIIEQIAGWVSKKQMSTEFFLLESEHSVLSAAVASELCGSRTFTATSSQGLMLMKEIMYIASGLRLPIVMVNVSRGLSAPITLWSDHNDFLSCRDSGWIMIAAETNQELLDTIIQAYRVAEDEKVLLPVLVNMDGFIHSYTREEVELPSQQSVDKFLPKLKLPFVLNPKKPASFGVPVMDEYMYFRGQQHRAMKNAEELLRHTDERWRKKFRRRYGLVERFHMNDADYALVTAGANSTIAKEAVSSLRAEGEKVGLLRLRVIRPWPADEIREALKYVRCIAVLDQNIAPGSGGILHKEIKATLHHDAHVTNFILGLGGRYVSAGDFKAVYNRLKGEKTPSETWLMD